MLEDSSQQCFGRRGLKRGRKTVQYLGPGAGAEKWRVRGGGAGGAERRGRTEVQVRAEAWGAAAAQTVRWSARMCMFILCHSTT